VQGDRGRVARVNFRPELAALVMAGEKTVTRRLVSDNPNSPWWEGGCKLKVARMRTDGGWDPTYAVCPGRGKNAIGRVRIVAVDGPIPLGILTIAEARHEGFASPQEFQDTIIALHGEYDRRALVWRIEFEVFTKGEDR
jgi:hypothetical protein